MTRRSFLYMATATAALALAGCDLPLVGQRKSAPSVPYGLWEAMREGARSSPDHVAAAAGRAVTTKDPAAIFAFVRDQIGTYPPATAVSDLGTAIRWGVRGTLRGGAGTPREKADLLAALYQRSGFKAEVVTGTLDAQVSLPSIFRSVPRRFAPKVDLATIQSWRAAMGVKGSPQTATRLDADGSQSKALADAIAAALPLGSAAGESTVPSLRNVPLVRVQTPAGAKYANPNVPGAEFGKSYTTSEPVAASSAEKAPQVTVKLFASTTADPIKRIPLVEKTWGADDLVGRRLHVAFRPTPDLRTLVHLKVRDVQTFVPVLSLSGPDLDAETAANLSASGPAISIGGDLITAAGERGVAVNGQPLAVPSSLDPHAGDAVAKLAIDAASQGFPTIRLRLTAVDGSGKAVEGLSSSAFRLQEQDSRLGFLLSGNQVPPPRVMLVLDLDSNFTSGGDPIAFARTLTQRLLTRHPAAAFQVMSVSGGNSPTQDGFTLRDPEAVATAVKPLFTYGSEIWGALQYANQARPTVIVMTSDFAPDETSGIDAYRALVAAGAPVVAIGVGQFNQKVRDDIAQLSGGVAGAAASIDEAAKAAGDFLDRRQTQPYTLTYTAPTTGPAQRTVTVTTAKGVTAQAQYTVPPVEQRTVAPALSGLYLSVQTGWEPEVVRVLAGYRADTRPASGLVPQEALDEVRGALLGGTVLSFEGAAPSLATWLDDILTARLGTKHFWDAVATRDQAKIVAALGKGLPFTPSALMALHPPIAAGEQPLTHEVGLRAVLYKEYPRFGKGRLREVDVLPFTRWANLSPDPAKAFAATLRQSAYQAVAEAAALPTSTLSLLKGKPLRALPPGPVFGSGLDFAPAESRARWTDLLNAWSSYIRVVPAGGDPVAFWAVDPHTGSLLGVIDDGSGGSFANDVECQINDLNSLLSLIGLFGELAGMGALGVWAIFGKLVAAQVLRATAIIANLDAEGVGAQAQDAVNQFDKDIAGVACDLLKALATSAVLPFVIGEGAASAVSAGDWFADTFHMAIPCTHPDPAAKFC